MKSDVKIEKWFPFGVQPRSLYIGEGDAQIGFIVLGRKNSDY
jgi:hypothetical protein